MEENPTIRSSYRISGMPVLVGRVSNPSAHPGQNGGFSDGFLTKRRVESCDSEEPGKTTDPLNPMKSRDYPPSEGYPAHPPTPQFVSNGLGCWRFKRWDENTAQRAMGLNAVGDRIDDRIHPRSEISA
jgi:hypothetical protein